jgi:hypothetical protein
VKDYEIAGSGYATSVGADSRPPYGYEQASERLWDCQKELDHKIERLTKLLDPILEVGPPPQPANDKAQQHHPSALLQTLHGRAEGFLEALSRFERLIERIRL